MHLRALWMIAKVLLCHCQGFWVVAKGLLTGPSQNSSLFYWYRPIIIMIMIFWQHVCVADLSLYWFRTIIKESHLRMSALYLWGSGGAQCVMTGLIVFLGFKGLSICSGDFKEPLYWFPFTPINRTLCNSAIELVHNVYVQSICAPSVRSSLKMTKSKCSFITQFEHYIFIRQTVDQIRSFSSWCIFPLN